MDMPFIVGAIEMCSQVAFVVATIYHLHSFILNCLSCDFMMWLWNASG